MVSLVSLYRPNPSAFMVKFSLWKKSSAQGTTDIVPVKNIQIHPKYLTIHVSVWVIKPPSCHMSVSKKWLQNVNCAAGTTPAVMRMTSLWCSWRSFPSVTSVWRTTRPSEPSVFPGPPSSLEPTTPAASLDGEEPQVCSFTTKLVQCSCVGGSFFMFLIRDIFWHLELQKSKS